MNDVQSKISAFAVPDVAPALINVDATIAL
jgi:hypothetical protein